MFDKRLLAETRSQRALLAASLLFNLLAAASVVLQAWLLAGAIDAVFLAGQGLTAVRPQLAQLALVIAVRSLAAGGGEALARLIGIRIKGGLREALMGHLFAQGPAAIGHERSGELATTLVEGVEALQAYFGEYLPALALAAVLPIVILATVFPLDLLTGIVLLVTAPLIPFFMALIGRAAEERTQRQWKQLGRLGAHFLDVMQGLTTLKLFGRSRDQAEGIRSASRAYAEATLGVLRIAFLSALALELLATLSTAVVAVEIGLRLLYGGILFRQALFILILAPEFYQPLRTLGAKFHAGMAGVAAAGRIFTLLNKPVQRKGGQAAPAKLKRISFQELGFTYPDNPVPILHHVSFDMEAGSLTALVGPSGAGKSTLMQLLLGFLTPTEGHIMVNGHSLESLDIESWRAGLAWVPQRPYLFNATVADNLRLARPEANEAVLWAALKAAHLAETVAELPAGLETAIGERGARLSGGQAQRLALGRAYVKDAGLLLFDEPAVYLDTETAAAVNAALTQWRAGRTALVIAHRQESIQQADQVLLVKGGRVSPVERGKALGTSDLTDLSFEGSRT